MSFPRLNTDKRQSLVTKGKKNRKIEKVSFLRPIFTEAAPTGMSEE